MDQRGAGCPGWLCGCLQLNKQHLDFIHHPARDRPGTRQHDLKVLNRLTMRGRFLWLISNFLSALVQMEFCCVGLGAVCSWEDLSEKDAWQQHELDVSLFWNWSTETAPTWNPGPESQPNTTHAQHSDLPQSQILCPHPQHEILCLKENYLWRWFTAHLGVPGQGSHSHTDNPTWPTYSQPWFQHWGCTWTSHTGFQLWEARPQPWKPLSHLMGTLSSQWNYYSSNVFG